MSSRRRLLDRFMRLAAPRPIDGYAPPPRELAPAIWGLDRQLRLPGGMRLPSRTTIVRLRDGALVVISAPPLVDADAVSAIASLGPVRQVVAPNSFHYVYAAEFMRGHPDASLVAAPGLVERVPGLPRAEELGPDPPDEWSGELEHALLGPVRGISEVVLFHVPTRTLILTDLAFNMTRFDRFFDRVAWRWFGVPREFGPSRTARLLLLRDREAAARCLRGVCEWPIERIVVAHGDVVEHEAKTRFLKAFAGFVGSAEPDRRSAAAR